LAAIDSTADATENRAIGAPGVYAWVVFALTFGLLISDYMSRQVLSAVFPLLKAEWGLTDVQLGSLSGIIALMVGLLTFPLSLLAERFGRVRSLFAMAVLWSLATLGCAVAKSYEQMMFARFLVGLGEAAYGSVGIAVVLSVFPARMRATLTGAFMAGGMAGSVLGVGLGGLVAAELGWRWAFAAMALFGLLLAIPYPFVVKETGDRRATAVAGGMKALRERLVRLVSSRTVICAFLGSGLQLFIVGGLVAWMPSYLGRYYAMAPDRAGGLAAGLLLVSGAGMVFWGMVSDRLSREGKPRKVTLAAGLCMLCFFLLTVAFAAEPGPHQLVLIAAGLFVAAGVTGPSGAMVANLTHPAVHGAAFALLTLANNLLGLAPGPVVTGMLADALGLDAALQWIPVVSILAAACFVLARTSYAADLKRTAEA
jgi:MFS family permease